MHSNSKYFTCKWIWLLLLSVACYIQPNSGAKILAVSFISSVSHKITYEPLLTELAARGHEVTVLMPVVSGKNTSNLREIQTIDLGRILGNMPNWFEMRERGDLGIPFLFPFFGQACAETFDQPHVHQILKEKFDAVIMLALFNECTAGFVHKLNTTLILISPTTAASWMSSIFGNPSPTSFVPHLFSGFDDRMNFWQRSVNMLTDLFVVALRKLHFEPKMASIYRERLGDSTIPYHDEIVRNASLILSTSHFSMSKARPFLPDIVEVGGMHCRPAKPLPKDLGQFLNSNAPHGFIYFSMGSMQKGSQMPERYRQIFVRTFARLKQKVLWKWETEQMDDLPPNVKLSKWLPQQDVLGHPNIKTFLTHGGFGGTAEAVYHGVPLVGLPMLGDQFLNMKKSVDAGFAISLEITTLTEEGLYNALTEVVEKPTYREQVQKLSRVFRDQPQKPLDRAVFWVEYVLRHQGAVHLRSAARDLNFFQYHSIDVILSLVAVGFVLVAILLRVLVKIAKCMARIIFGIFRGKSSESKPKKQKQKLN